MNTMLIIFLLLFVIPSQEKILSRFFPKLIETDDDPKTIEYIIKLNKKSAHLVLTKQEIPQYSPSITFNNVDISYLYNYHDCNYEGYVNGMKNSKIYLLACNGFKGKIFDGESMWNIHPNQDVQNIEFSDITDHEHVTYQNISSPTTNYTCGTSDNHEKLAKDYVPQLNFQSGNERISNRYIKLSYIVDCKTFASWAFNSDINYTIEYIFDISRQLNYYYDFANITAIVMHLEILSNESLCRPLNDSANLKELLLLARRYREDLTRIDKNYDVTVYISHIMPAGVAGATWLNMMCSSRSELYTYIGQRHSTTEILGHEIGHLLNLDHNHDRPDCKTENGLISMMHTGFSGASYKQYTYEDCDRETIWKSISSPNHCFYQNLTINPVKNSYCGNGVIDIDEECDCGAPFNCHIKGLDTCCNPYTCKLFPLHYCKLNPECCNNCKGLSSNTRCYKTNLCKSGYCDSNLQKCVLDRYLSYPSLCENNRVCLNGKCISLVKACQKIFGVNSTIASESCYQNINARGDMNGSCGRNISNSSQYIKCLNKDDSKCGNLICTYHNVILDPKIKVYINNANCASILENDLDSEFSNKYRTDGSYCNSKSFICDSGRCTNGSLLNTNQYQSVCLKSSKFDESLGYCVCLKNHILIETECVKYIPKNSLSRIVLFAVMVTILLIQLLMPLLVAAVLCDSPLKKYLNNSRNSNSKQDMQKNTFLSYK